MPGNNRYRSTIEFGARTDPSIRRSTRGIENGIHGMEQRAKKFRREQKRLADEMRRMTLAGQNVSNLRGQYERLGRQIERTEQHQRRLNRTLLIANRRDRIKKGAKALAGQAGKASLWAGGAVMGGIGSALLAPALLNNRTAERIGHARNYGVDLETYTAWDSMAKLMNLTGENIGDLNEELKNKVGEYRETGQMSAVEDAMSILKFKAGDFGKMDTYQIFEKIMQRAFDMIDEPKAAAAVDMLMGGEANKIITYMRQTGRSYQSLLEEQKKYNLVTKEGADGALKNRVAINHFMTVLSTGAEEVAGLLGNELAPKTQELAEKLASWIKTDGLQTIKDEWIPAGLQFARGVETVGKVVWALAKKLEWLIPEIPKNDYSSARSIFEAKAMAVKYSEAKADDLNLKGEERKQFMRNEYFNAVNEYNNKDNFTRIKNDAISLSDDMSVITKPSIPAATEQINKTISNNKAGSVKFEDKRKYEIILQGAPTAEGTANVIQERLKSMESKPRFNNSMYDSAEPQ